MNTLLVCLDFSDHTDALLDEAKIFASGICDRVVLLHVVQPGPDFTGYETGLDYSCGKTHEILVLREGQTKALAETWKQALGDFEVIPLTVQGIPRHEILHQAEALDATHILMGTHGHGKLYHLLMGSTAQGVLNHTSVPVIFVPISRP
ncbi:MAG: universal stress protein [Phycisphaerales bacterium]|jgi:nucleotide-binding universal stress UspA family protein|nr:universal stress protein [Phycisphaerales bacterium]MBT7170583.1 universal stress protein [Phycisphaerales bacterium]